MICRECAHPYIGKSKGDADMAAMGYRSCAAARSVEEQARYVAGATPCVYPERFRPKERQHEPARHPG